MKRIAYIGISSPIGYFYDFQNIYFKQEWDWNPIIESPQGLITLFDELWFLTRSLCPINLRNETYVKFLDENSFYTKKISRVCRDFFSLEINDFINIYPYISKSIDVHKNFSDAQFKKYWEVISSIYGKDAPNYPIDNHSHSFNFSGYNLSGNSMRSEYLAFDIAVVGKINLLGLELISNSFNINGFNTPNKTFNNTKVSEGVTIKKIPVLQTPVGPVIKDIERLRESKYLMDFREKINSDFTEENIVTSIESIEKEFVKYRNDTLLNHQDKSRLLTSISTTFFEWGADLISLGGTIIFKKQVDDYNTRKKSWTGFIASIEQ